MARLVLIDTVDQLPGLLPLHGWSALMASELVVVGSDDHPFLGHLQAADLRTEVVPDEVAEQGLSRADLLGGLSPDQKGRAEWVVDRARQEQEVAYIFGAADTEAFTRTLGMEAARAGVEVEVVYFGVPPKGAGLLELVGVEERLLAPDGCPWDREQTHRSLAPYAVEEVYELLEAIDAGDSDAICEELGDVLLQVVFHAALAARAGQFDIDEVARGIVTKLVNRHPHVFGDVEVASAEEVKVRWEELKAEEKPEREGPFGGVPHSQPALPYVHQLQSRAAKLGFDWQAHDDAAERVTAELEELRAAETDDERAAEVGDVLMSVVGLARRYGVDPEMALRSAGRRFRARFEAMLAATTKPPDQLSRQEWLTLWDAAKEVPSG